MSSRRQTRLTALDIMAYAAADDRPRVFLRMTGGLLCARRQQPDTACVMAVCGLRQGQHFGEPRVAIGCAGAPQALPCQGQRCRQNLMLCLVIPHADHELEQNLALIRDSALRDTLQFGIGLHHAGLPDGDREVVEKLYVEGKIQVRRGAHAWHVWPPAWLAARCGRCGASIQW